LRIGGFPQWDTAGREEDEVISRQTRQFLGWVERAELRRDGCTATCRWPAAGTEGRWPGFGHWEVGQATETTEKEKPRMMRCQRVYCALCDVQIQGRENFLSHSSKNRCLIVFFSWLVKPGGRGGSWFALTAAALQMHTSVAGKPQNHRDASCFGKSQRFARVKVQRSSPHTCSAPPSQSARPVMLGGRPSNTGTVCGY
jgi:hypothetical protein